MVGFRFRVLVALTVMASFSVSAFAEMSEKMSYEQEVARVSSEGLVTKDLTAEANKCEVLQVMSRAFKWDLDSSDSMHPFTDVPEWCGDVASYAFENAIVKGRSETVLGVQGVVSRYEVAVMLYRELTAQGFEFVEGVEPNFSDKDAVPEWAQDAVMILAENALFKGFSDGSFGGEKGVLKQDLGVVILRAADHEVEEGGVDEVMADEAILGSWVWTETVMGEEMTTGEEVDGRFVLHFTAEGTFNVEGDCNAINGDFENVEEGVVDFGDSVAMTKMFCEGSYENEFVESLLMAQFYEFSGDEKEIMHLSLFDSAGDEVGSMTFVDKDSLWTAEEAVVGQWVWEKTTKGAEVTMADVATKPFVLTIAADGGIGVTGDCNVMGGSVRAVDGEVEFSDLIQTLMFCEGSYETYFSNDLLASVEYRVEAEGDALVLVVGGEKPGEMMFTRKAEEVSM